MGGFPGSVRSAAAGRTRGLSTNARAMMLCSSEELGLRCSRREGRSDACASSPGHVIFRSSSGRRASARLDRREREEAGGNRTSPVGMVFLTGGGLPPRDLIGRSVAESGVSVPTERPGREAKPDGPDGLSLVSGCRPTRLPRPRPSPLAPAVLAPFRLRSRHPPWETGRRRRD